MEGQSGDQTGNQYSRPLPVPPSRADSPQWVQQQRQMPFDERRGSDVSQHSHQSHHSYHSYNQQYYPERYSQMSNYSTGGYSHYDRSYSPSYSPVPPGHYGGMRQRPPQRYPSPAFQPPPVDNGEKGDTSLSASQENSTDTVTGRNEVTHAPITYSNQNYPPPGHGQYVRPPMPYPPMHYNQPHYNTGPNYRPPMNYGNPTGFVPVRSNLARDFDNMSLHSVATNATGQTALRPLPSESLESYRQQVKKSNDPVMQFDFAKHLISVAEEMRKNPQGLDPQKIKKNRDILHAEAVRWIKKAASSQFLGKNGLPEALFFLADCYGNGTLGLTIDHDRAFGYYSQAAKQGHSASIYRTGVCYEVGAGPKRNPERAIQFYKKAAIQGDTAAMFKVGMILLKGTLGQTPNPREGVNFLKRAAAQADETTPYALHELGILFEGIDLDPATGVVPDPNHAVDLFMKSAKMGYAPSQYKLGLAYEYGHMNLQPDPRRSIGWYTKAAEQGDPEAELALSGWYLTGCEGLLPQNDKEAYLWAKKAADKGLAKAEYAVAYFLENGIGINRDLEEARRWYVRAAGQGNPRAIARLKDKGPSQSHTKPADWRKESDTRDGNCSVM
ncbi:hypothetical protein HDV04_004668 [Boothiomyces sp. JEL0838]|nr:hypothetical protein HDV04_004668 [Boothiomyces sp. JEL0838]